MKYLITVLFVAIIFVTAFLPPSFVDNVFVNNTSIAKNQAGQERNQVTKHQNTTAKGDSFTAEKAFGEDKARPDSMEATVGRGKNYLLTQVDNRLKQLDPFRTRVKNMTTLSDSERTNLVSELNAEIDMFEAFKPEINRSATKQDIINVAEKIKAEWIKSRLSVERAEGQIVAAKENHLISDADAASDNIQKRIDALKASGKNTKAHEELLAAYDKKIASAKQNVETAKEKFGEAASAPTANEKDKLIRGKELLLMSAQNNIKDAYKILTDEARREFSQRYK